MKITLDRKQLLAFRKQCRANYPRETMAVLRGKRTTEGVEIEAIQDFPHTGTVDASHYGDKQIPRAKMKALRKGAEFIGTIHSHCLSKHFDCCGHPSDADIRTALKQGEAVMGIVYVYQGGQRTEVNWYVPKPQPEVIYV